MNNTTTLQVHGMTCGGCEKAVSQAALGVAGVSQALANRAENRLNIVWAEAVTEAQSSEAIHQVLRAITDAGFECSR